MSFLEQQRLSIRQFLSKIDFASLFADIFMENGCTSLVLAQMLSKEELEAMVEADTTRESIIDALQTQMTALRDGSGSSERTTTAPSQEAHLAAQDGIRTRPRSISQHMAMHSNSTRNRASSVTSMDSTTEIYNNLYKQFPNMRKKFVSRGDVEIYKGMTHDSRWRHDDTVQRGILVLLKCEVSKEYFIMVGSRGSTHPWLQDTGNDSPSAEDFQRGALGSTEFIYPVYGKFELLGKESDIFMRKFVALETQRNTHFIGIHFLGSSAGGASLLAANQHPVSQGSAYSQVDSIIARKDTKDFSTQLMSCLNINQVELYKAFCPIKYNIPGGDPSESIQEWMEPVLKGHGFHFPSIPKVWRKFLLDECKLKREMLEDPQEAKKILKVLMDEMKDIQKSTRRLSISLGDMRASPEHAGYSPSTPPTDASRARRFSISRRQSPFTSSPIDTTRHSNPHSSTKRRSVSNASSSSPYVPPGTTNGDFSPSLTSSSYENSLWEDLPEDFDDGTPLPPSSPTTPSTVGSFVSQGNAFPSGNSTRSTPIAVRGRGRSVHEVASPLISSPLVASLKDSSKVQFASSTLTSQAAMGTLSDALQSSDADDDVEQQDDLSTETSSPSNSTLSMNSPPSAPPLAGLNYIQKVQRGFLQQNRKSMSNVLRELATSEVSSLLKPRIEEKAEEFYSDLLKRGIQKAEEGEE